MKTETIPQLFEESAKKYSGNTALWEKTGDRYEGMSYHDLREKVFSLAAGLVSLGIKKGDRIALLSEGRNYWVIAELAILYAGAVNVPISVKVDELSDLKFRLSHSGCRMAVVSGNQNRKIRQIKNDLADLEKIVVMDRQDEGDPDEIFIQDLIQAGGDFLIKNKARMDEILAGIGGSDPANICYTSGTTADPKGIILTHRNYTANVEQSSAIFDIPEWYVSLLILPWDHSFAHTAGIYTLLKNGASMASIQPGKTALETLKNIPVNIREIRPSFLLSVPALAKSFRKNIEKGVQEKGEKIEKLFNTALEKAYAYHNDGLNRAKGLRGLLLKIQNGIFNALLFSKIRESFGGRLKFFVGGGALLDIDMQKFFYAIGLPMYQGYGLTEAAPIISANTPDAHKLGTSGKVVPNLELRICDEKGNVLPSGQKGEIVVRGENVMAGYWKNDKATAETLKDGWLYTGDLGYLDDDGYLNVLGRFKSLLIASDGEKYSPEGIEEAITEHSPYIEQIMLYNNQSPYTSALVVPDRAALRKALEQKGLNPATGEGQETALKWIEEGISVFRENGMFPSRWVPSAIAVLGEGFTEQNHLLNSTMKMVRGKIVEMYRSRIDYLYTAEGKDILNHENRTIISRI